MMTDSRVELFSCPICRGPLEASGSLAGGFSGRVTARGDRFLRGELLCARGGHRFAVEEGLPRLYREEEVRGTDRLMRLFYDGLPKLHDPLTKMLLPVLQLGGSEDEGRRRYMERLQLGTLAN